MRCDGVSLNDWFAVFRRIVVP